MNFSFVFFDSFELIGRKGRGTSRKRSKKTGANQGEYGHKTVTHINLTFNFKKEVPVKSQFELV